MVWIGTGPRRDVWDKVCGATEACEAGFNAGYEGPAVAASGRAGKGGTGGTSYRGESGASESSGPAAMERANAYQSRGRNACRDLRSTKNAM